MIRRILLMRIRHQRQALFFMVKREMGWALEDGACDVWTKVTHVTGAL
jgi:SWI/SNF-related matrix-associated actin-dependent regulator of chromatin subfamily A3